MGKAEESGGSARGTAKAARVVPLTRLHGGGVKKEGNWGWLNKKKQM